jgi:hypothetical protein
MKKPRNMSSALNITLGSVALFLVVLPEPATTLAGLALLGYISNSAREQSSENGYSHYRGEPSYGSMVYKKASLGLETTSLTKRGVLASPQIVLSPAYAYSHNWKHSEKPTGSTHRSGKDISAPEQGLLARSRTTSFTPNTRQVHTNNASNQPARGHKASHTGVKGELPRSWPNLRGSYHENSKTPEQKKLPVSKGFSNTTSTSLNGRLPTPWPNMPETRFTRKIQTNR